MKRLHPGVACAIVSVLVIQAAGAQTSEPPAVLGDMRQALGGVASLDAVESFTLAGRSTRIADAGPPIEHRIEISCQLPDKCLRTSIRMGPVRAPNGSTHIGPVGSTFDGYNLDFPIRGSRDASGRPNATFVSSPVPPEEAERRLTLVARGYQREFARLTLALFGRSFSGYPIELRHLGRESRGDRQVEVVESIGPDGAAAALLIDAASRLPSAIVWRASPSRVLTNTGRATLDLPPPPAVDHRMVFSDFRAQHGLNWPRVITEYVGARLIRETRIERVAINPKFPDGFFSVTR